MTEEFHGADLRRPEAVTPQTSAEAAVSRRVWIGLGGNLGDRLDLMRQAVFRLAGTRGIRIEKVSSLYESEPVGVTDQPPFYNAVVQAVCGLEPLELLDACQAIERDLGRVRLLRWGPRTIDLDILIIEGVSLESERLTVPHPRMRERDFVQVPLAELSGGCPKESRGVRLVREDWVEVPTAEWPTPSDA